MNIVNIPSRKQIEELEQFILQLPQIEMPITHDFAEGLYARTMFIPNGVVLTGAIHKEENFFFVREGELIVWTEEGMRRLSKGQMIKSKAGCKRAGFTLKDTIVTTVHANANNIKDPDVLWNLFTVPSDYILEDKVSI